MSVLNSVLSDKYLKNLTIKQLNELCEEIRAEIIKTAYQSGGHLSPNLGSVELTVAIYYVFNLPTDKLIFDVGHQCYTHKILSGRFNNFETIRQENGISGFPDSSESEFDAFSVGHSGTSISAGLGYCEARDRKGENYYVIDVVGDASLLNGENLEALSYCDVKPKNFLVILNDNGMSISKNDNALYKVVSKITTKKHYNKFNNFLSKTIGKSFVGKFLRGFKKFVKRSLNINTFIDGLGIKYVGIFDGHDLKTLIPLLKNIKESGKSTLLHVKTVKGKGFSIAENDSTKFHGISAGLNSSVNYFSDNVSNILESVVEKYPLITAITAAMPDGVGLKDFSIKHPKNFKDVGICEEFAVTYAAGMAKGGIKPIVFIYSTFLQRSYDQILHDVCIQNLPVIFCIDRSGFVGGDGKTHQGLFDLSYLSHLPNMTVIAPKDIQEFKEAILYALNLNSPVAIRYPNGKSAEYKHFVSFEKTLWEYDDLSKDNIILAVGNRMIDLAEKIKLESDKSIGVINARFVKPLDNIVLDKIYDKNIITLEENSEIGGFGAEVLLYYSKKQLKANVNVFGAKDKFVSQATACRQRELNGLTVENIKKVLI